MSLPVMPPMRTGARNMEFGAFRLLSERRTGLKLEYHLLDVFTRRQFGGNPLAVFPNADGVPERIMQSIANELNLSETTFIQRPRAEASDCTVRIFTPKRELPMAGHPTIGAAFAILRNGLVEPKSSGRLVFDEGVGAVAVDFSHDGGRPSDLWMRQPLPAFLDILDSAMVARLLSLDSSEIVADRPVQVVSCGLPVILVPLRSLDSVRRVAVRQELLESELRQIECRELFVFTLEAENPEATVHCRMFAPCLGIPEDPATGSAHGPLGSYLFRYGLSDGTRIVSEQGFEMGRPSTIQVRICSSGCEITNVLVGGECVEVGSGVIQLAEDA